MATLDDGALATALRELPAWTRDGVALTRTFRRRDWRDAIAFVNAVADEADRRDHHPDVSITGYRNVAFRLTSHDAGGVTRRDVNLAKRIDDLAAELEAELDAGERDAVEHEDPGQVTDPGAAR
jgi:4a-hydroxytetrahydrobiopterin dehydratase